MQHDQLSFGDQERAVRQSGTSRASVRLQAISQFVNWPVLEALLPGKDMRSESARRRGGRPRYPEKIMLRLIMLQFLYDLSDVELEEQVIDRSSFQEFAQISGQYPIPDFTTIWRFKEELIRHGTLAMIFDAIGRDLEGRGLVLKQGTIIDATVIPSIFNDPLKRTERESLLQQELATGKPHRYLDSEARSTRKVDSKGHSNFFYGYKGHIAIDVGSKLVQRTFFSSANRQDIEYYPDLARTDPVIYADKGYQKSSHRKEAEGRGVIYNVMRKGNKHHQLGDEDRAFNQSIASTRRQIEHVFGYMKTKLSLHRTRARGLVRNRLRFEMNVILYNINRAMFLLRTGLPQKAIIQ
jgi:transposase, IS5 family